MRQRNAIGPQRLVLALAKALIKRLRREGRNWSAASIESRRPRNSQVDVEPTRVSGCSITVRRKVGFSAFALSFAISLAGFLTDLVDDCRASCTEAVKELQGVMGMVEQTNHT